MLRSWKVVLGWATCGAVCVFLVAVLIGQGLEQASLWSGLVVAVAAVAALLFAMPLPDKAPAGPVLGVPDWVIKRPSEMAAVVKALTGRQAGTVGLTTGLHGAGGFGKTTLAHMVCADSAVRRWFAGRVYLVTMGRDVRGAAAVAAKVNDVIKLVTGADAAFADPDLAGQRLGAVLDSGPRRLLVIDDVWEPGQLAPLTYGGRRCARLVTTRVPGLLTGRGSSVRVDQMSEEQARELLTYGLPPIDPAIREGLLAETGRWPLLLRLVNKILANTARTVQDISPAGALLLERLRESGPAVVDELLGEAGGTLDVNQPQERARAIRATIEASTSLLDERDAERFAELAVFAEDEALSLDLVAMLWKATAGLDALHASQVCARLSELALLTTAGTGTSTLAMHDVVREYLRGELGAQRLAKLHELFLSAVAASLPGTALPETGPAEIARTAWWELGSDQRYLWDHLIEHLQGAGRADQADAIACDLRWAGARLQRFGPAAPAADLGQVATPRAGRLRGALAQAAHLLGPTEPPDAVVDVLHSRISGYPEWAPQALALRENSSRTRLVNLWRLPDLPSPALRYVLTVHSGPVRAIAAAPDGSWLASGYADGTVRIWDARTWQNRSTLAGHQGEVRAMAVAPDGSWLACGSDDEKVRIWTIATGRPRAVLASHSRRVTALVASPDGCWLAAGCGFTVRIWDTSRWRSSRALTVMYYGEICSLDVTPDGGTLLAGTVGGMLVAWPTSAWSQSRLLSTGPEPVMSVAVVGDGSWLITGGERGASIWDTAVLREDPSSSLWCKRSAVTGAENVAAVAVAPDGSWLATGSSDGAVRICGTRRWDDVAVLAGHSGEILALAATSGGWLASGSSDGTVRIWDVHTARSRSFPTGHVGSVISVAVSADGRQLVTTGRSRTAHVRDAVSGQARSAILTDHQGRLTSVAVAPDGTWLVTGSDDATARVWSTTSRTGLAVLTGHVSAITAIAVAPDGNWLATASHDGTVRIWDTRTWRTRAVLSHHRAKVADIAIAADGSWLATGHHDGTVRIWHARTWRQRAHLDARGKSVTTVAVAADDSWLAAGSDDGTIRIWDLRAHAELATLQAHHGTVTALAASPGGRWLATVGQDGTVRIWGTATWQPQALMRADGALQGCAWLGADSVAASGTWGLYSFTLLTTPKVPR